jgi:hypothetical protein
MSGPYAPAVAARAAPDNAKQAHMLSLVYYT